MFAGWKSYRSVPERRREGGALIFIYNTFESNKLHDHSINYDCLEFVCANVKKRIKNIVSASTIGYLLTPSMNILLTFLVVR